MKFFPEFSLCTSLYSVDFFILMLIISNQTKKNYPNIPKTNLSFYGEFESNTIHLKDGVRY